MEDDRFDIRIVGLLNGSDSQDLTLAAIAAIESLGATVVSMSGTDGQNASLEAPVFVNKGEYRGDPIKRRRINMSGFIRGDGVQYFTYTDADTGEVLPPDEVIKAVPGKNLSGRS